MVAVLLATQATVTDQMLERHDRLSGTRFSEAKRTHLHAFHEQGKAINEQVRLYARVGHALIDARQSGADPFAAIEAVVPWATFTQSITEADQLAQPAAFDHPPLIADGYRQVRRYAPRLLDCVAFHAAPVAHTILEGIDTLRAMHQANARVVPKDSPIGFVKPRWEPHVLQEGGIDRRFYELCALSERKDALRAGDVWVPGSRQFKDFEDSLPPRDRFVALRDAGAFPTVIAPDGDQYPHDRLALLTAPLPAVDQLAARGAPPAADLADELLKVKPLTKSVPAGAERLEEVLSGIVPHLKITDLLLEVDRWTDCTRHCRHLRTHTSSHEA